MRGGIMRVCLVEVSLGQWRTCVFKDSAFTTGCDQVIGRAVHAMGGITRSLQ